MILKFIEEKERVYDKFGENGAYVIFSIDGVHYEALFINKSGGQKREWQTLEIKRLGSQRKSKFKDDKQKEINEFFKKHYNVNDEEKRYLKVNEKAVLIAENVRLSKVIYNRVKNYGWNTSTAKTTAVRKKRKNDINRKYDIVRHDGTVLHSGVTIEEAHKILKVKRSTVRSYTGHKYKEKVIARKKGIYLTDSKQK